jgi:hypothetical protein
MIHQVPASACRGRVARPDMPVILIVSPFSGQLEFRPECIVDMVQTELLGKGELPTKLFAFQAKYPKQ